LILSSATGIERSRIRHVAGCISPLAEVSCFAEPAMGILNNMSNRHLFLFDQQSITVMRTINVIGTWKEITFNEEHRPVRWTRELMEKAASRSDPRSRVWDGSKASRHSGIKAKKTR
jgi:hypothetical protein